MDGLCVGESNGFAAAQRILLSMVEFSAVEAILVAGKSLVCVIFAAGSLSSRTDLIREEDETIKGFPVAPFARNKVETVPENKDAGDSEDDGDDEDSDDAGDDQDDEGDEDVSGGEGNDDEDEDDDDPEANAGGGSKDEDDDDEDDSEDDEDEDEDEDEEEEEEEEEEDEEKPPSKKRK